MSLNFDTLGETIAVFNKSGEVVSTTKHLYNVFKEAQEAYKKARTGLIDQYNSTFNQTSNERRPQNHETQFEWASDDEDVNKPARLEGRRRMSPNKPSRSVDRSHDYFNSKEVSRPAKYDESPLSKSLMQHDNNSLFLSPFDTEDDGIDTDLAFGEYHAETFEQIHRNAEEDMKGLMAKTQQMLIEAKCAEASAVATINHLQSNPEAMAAIALTLAEASKLAKNVGPHILNALKVAFPSAFALLACPQFLVASSVGIGITIVMIGGYKIIKRIKAACTDEDEAPLIEERALPPHLADDFQIPRAWSPPPASLHTPTCVKGDTEWQGIPRMASRLQSRPSVDRSEVYELESSITGVHSWLQGLDEDGSRSHDKPERELMTPLAAHDSGFTLDNGGRMHPPPRRRHTYDRDEYSSREASSIGSGSTYAASKFSISTDSSTSSRGSPPKFDRPQHGRRHDSGISLDDEEELYTKDGKPVKVRRSRAPSERREPIMEEVDDHSSRTRTTRESRPRATRSHRSHSTERRSRSRRPEPFVHADSIHEEVESVPSGSSRPTRMLRRVRSISSPSEGLSEITSSSRRAPNEANMFSQPYIDNDHQTSRNKTSKTAKMMGILTLGMSNREGRSSRQTQHQGSSRRSKSASDENRMRSRSEGRCNHDTGSSEDTSSRFGRQVLQRQLQEKSRGTPGSAQAWYEKKGKSERRPSKLNPTGIKVHSSN
ncbi:hypothetical protein KEM56_001096 [Ascosphaera pollenicola]|nr:hypothetical protein KEM56_001096 [Ascosphaera pollenicola]